MLKISLIGYDPTTKIIVGGFLSFLGLIILIVGLNWPQEYIKLAALLIGIFCIIIGVFFLIAGLVARALN